MTGTDAWLRSNDEYLAAAVASLHARLRREAQAASPAAPGAPPAPTSLTIVRPAAAPTRSWLGRLLRPQPEVEDPGTDAANERHAQAAATAAEPAPPSPASGEPPAALTLQKLLGLTPFELDVLLLCAAMELDTRTASLCAQAQPDARPQPTFALALAIADEPSWEALSPERPLRYWRLIDIAAAEDQPLVSSPLRADERIVNYLKGLHHLDDRLSAYLTPVPIPPADQVSSGLSVAQRDQANEIAAHVRATGDAPVVIQLAGPASESKTLIAAEAARQAGFALYRLNAAALPSSASELNTWIRLWQRETVLLPVALVLDAGDRDERAAADGAPPAAARFLSQVDTLVFLLCREPWGQLGGDAVIVQVARPSPAEQAAAWTEALGGAEAAAASASRLASQYDLELPDIRRLAARQQTLGRTTLDDLWEACLAHSRPGLDLLAHRIDARATWDDLVLPDETLRLLHEIADQVRHRLQVYDAWGFRKRMSRGLGISVLFDGESGTGKTMAAEVMANELSLDLYRIDLSAVVSKYIGETEKNLRRVFDAADNGGGILFFDEADSIFGKRSEVKDSHDRYANIEINYLLQRIESYAGLAILASNMRSAIDQAFVRRLRFIVKFRVPGPVERQRIWAHAFPPDTPVEMDDPDERLDFERLARVNLTGGSITNVAVNAAFRAAAAGTKVTLSQVTSAIQTELKKADRAVTPV
jgi:hypothetical protein